MAALIQSGLDLSPIITHRFSIDEFQQGFDAMRSGQSGESDPELGLTVSTLWILCVVPGC